MRPFDGREGRRFEARQAMYLIGLVCLKYLSDRSVAPAMGSQHTSIRLVVPEEAKWELVRSDPTGNRLLRAIEEIEGQAEDVELGSIFTSMALPELAENPELLQRLFAVLENEEATSADGLPSAVDRMIEQYIRRAGWRGEEQYTSSDVAQLLAALLNPASVHTIYDPTCGTGTLLSTCYSHAVQSGGTDVTPTLFGQEIDAETAALARINTTVHADTQVRIATGDTLLSPAFTEGSSVQKFDRVVANPPLGLRMDAATLGALQEDRFGRFTLGTPQRTRDWAFLQHVVSSLNEEGRAAIVCSARRLVVSESQDVRKDLVESDLVEAVISLPGNVLAYTGRSAVVLVLNRAKPEELQGRTMFVFAQEEYERGRPSRRISKQHRKRLVNAVLQRREHRRFSALVSVDDIRQHGYELAPSRYIDIVGRDAFM